MKAILKEFGWGLLIILGMFILNSIYGAGLPDEMPRQFNASGEPVSYMSKNIFIYVMPLMLLGVMVITSGFIRLSPRIWGMPNTRPVIGQIYLAMGFLIASLHIGMLLNPHGGAGLTQAFGFGAAAFALIFGNIIGKTEPNFFIGLRLPWTLASENNWNATHRLTGKLSVISGLALFFASLFMVDIKFLAALFAFPIVIGIGYSFIYYWTRERPFEDQ